ncbi:MgtC/SapB family protein [Candidatus Woesearchaeota archaeon]|nr:MgtC/SapB family protein [Candidatus Woesearchaeota archaeon]
MIELGLFENFGIALLLGLIVGLEREFQHQQQKVQDFAGIRTFTLIALFGWLVGFVAQQIGSFELVLLGTAGMILFSIAGYIAVVWKGKGIGATSEISTIIVFLSGIIIAYNYILIAVISVILMTTILSYKYTLHKFAQKLALDEIHAGLKLGIISAVVLPLLPNKAYSPLDIPVLREIISLFPSVKTILITTQIFNPFKIWLMVVFICAISTIGYILIKTLGAKKGIGLIGAVGGLVSSTAVTSALSESSKKSKWYYTFAFGVIIAWVIMFFRVFFITLILNKNVFISLLLPLGIILLASLCCGFYLFSQRTPPGKKAETAVAFQSPFALLPALKIGAFFVFALFITKLLQALLGSSGIYFASFLAGFADIDAVVISMVTLTSAGEITSSIAALGIVLAALSNTITKAAIAYLFGGKQFAKKVLICTAIIVAAGILAVLVL